MNCTNCGSFLNDSSLEYCPSCGSNVMIQKKVVYLSKLYYNQGLEKASIRDLSGAISCLKQSLTYNKANIQARNLLGLVYFETGEVVAALSEWVISKNLQSSKNLASEYINRLQANANKLEAINETIRKYNHALILCKQGHEDMAAIQLKKILAQNSKLIKGYHLLALIQMRDHDWNKARRTLKKAARIDKTNTTTLRFLREVDEQTGVTTRLERSGRGFFHGGAGAKDGESGTETETAVSMPAYRERSKTSIFFILTSGIAIGAAAFWLLAVPAIRQGIYKEANEQIIQYSESLASQGAELSRVQGEAQQSGDQAQLQSEQLEVERTKSQSYENLLSAYSYLQDDEADSAAVEVWQVQPDVLSDAARKIYNSIIDRVGAAPEGWSASQAETSEEEETADSTGDSGTGDSSYSDSGSSYGTDSYSDSGSDYGDDGYSDSGSSYGDDGYSDSGSSYGTDSYSDSGSDYGTDSYSDSGSDYGTDSYSDDVYNDSGY